MTGWGPNQIKFDKACNLSLSKLCAQTNYCYESRGTGGMELGGRGEAVDPLTDYTYELKGVVVGCGWQNTAESNQ